MYISLEREMCTLLSLGIVSNSVSKGKVIKEEVTELVSNHEEADTLICMHVNHINSTKVQNIIIRASDTDIAVISQIPQKEV